MLKWNSSLSRFCPVLSLAALLGLTACGRQAAPADPPMQALPVQVETVVSSPIPQSDVYVATIKSRQAATINPQIDGNLTKILVHSGDYVRAGQELMEVDPTKQAATAESAKATERQKLAVFQYNQVEVERQRKLYQQGVTSKDALDQAEQAYRNSQADYQSAVAATLSQQEQLGYYKIAAPFDGVVGDIPVHPGDYVTPTTMLTTVDTNRGLEAYIYIPSERAAAVHTGLEVEIESNSDQPIEHTAISFVSPQVEDQLQGILVKAPVHSPALRNQQLVKAAVIWSRSRKPVVPVLSVVRVGGQSFVFVAQSRDGKYFARQTSVSLGDTVGNDYSVLGGLKDGDKVIISGTQFLIDGAPVQPLG